MFSTFSKILITVSVLTAIAGLTEAEVIRDGLISYWAVDRETVRGKTVNDLWGDNDGATSTACLMGHWRILAAMRTTMKCQGLDRSLMLRKDTSLV